MTNNKPDKNCTTFPVSETTLLVEFDNCIDNTISETVLSLKSTLEQRNLNAIQEVVPSYRSLLIHYDCLLMSLAEITLLVKNCAAQAISQTETSDKHWNIPVYYGGEAGADIDELAALHDMTTDDVIILHQQASYRVYLVGFAPGWCYLGGLPEQLHTPRLPSPRLSVPAGCISIGGQQGMIGGLSMPSGWRLIGQTPVRSYAPERTPPFFINAGDKISFYSIKQPEFDALAKAAAKGELVATEFNRP